MAFIFGFGKKKEGKQRQGGFDSSKETPVLHCSICNGEQVAGFKDLVTGHFRDIRLIRSEAELDEFRREYGITGDIPREY